jgi:TolB-like protein
LLRGALGDDPKRPAFIQTIPGVGYRLVAPVTIPGREPKGASPETASPDGPATTEKPRRRESDRPATTPAPASDKRLAPIGRLRRIFRLTALTAAAGFWIVQGIAMLGAETAPGWLVRALSLLMIAVCTAVVAVAWLQVVGPRGKSRFSIPLLRGSRADYALMALMLMTLVFAVQKPFVQPDMQIVSSDAPATEVPAGNVIAVLPFDNVSATSDTDYFSDGLTDELVSSLARVEGIKVIARSTSSTMKDSPDDVRTVGRKLGVSKLVSGTVRVDGRKLRISVQLVDAGDGYELWNGSYDATLDEIFAVQNQIATSIVAAVTPMLKSQAAETIAANGPPTRDKSAYLLFLRARHMIKRREEEPIRHAVVLLQEAIALDPAYSAAYIELAHAYALLPYYSNESQQKMFDAARSVIASGRERGADIGHAAEGLSAFMSFHIWDWIRAEESFQRALAHDANDPEVFQWYSQFQASLGHAGRSLEFALRAKELDALSPVVNDRLAVAYLWDDQDALAQRQFEEAVLLGLGPGANPRAYLLLLLRQHRYPEALGLMQAIQTRLGGSTDWVAAFIAAQQDTGQRETAVHALVEAERTGGIKPRLLFGAWIYLGEYDRAMDLANTLATDPANFDVEFLFARESAGFRRHPKFGALVTAIGLDRHWDVYGWPSACRRDGREVRC